MKYFLLISISIFMLCTINCTSKISIQDTITNDNSVDFLLLKREINEKGSVVELYGNHSEDLLFLKIITPRGEIKYDLGSSWYEAAHQSIVWLNNDKVLIYYGCGMSCWGAKVLDVNRKVAVSNYPFFIYSDKETNLIVYPDSLNTKSLIIKDLKTNKSKSYLFDFCTKVVQPSLAIDTVYKTEANNLIIEYFDENCVIYNRIISL